MLKKLTKKSRKENKVYCRSCNEELVEHKLSLGSLYLSQGQQIDPNKPLTKQGHFLQCEKSMRYLKEI